MDSWQSMALMSLHASSFTNSFFVADKLLAKRCAGPAQCLLNDELMQQAWDLGKHVAQCCKTPVAERKWLGDPAMGWCPNCHSNGLMLGFEQWDGVHWPVECVVCGAGGDLVKNEQTGKWDFVRAKDGLIRDRTLDEGRAKHLEEIGATHGMYYQHIGEVQEKLKKFKEMKFAGI
jgi:hypothetical protein